MCRKDSVASSEPPSREAAVAAAKEKLSRLERTGFTLSRNDQKIALFGQLLTTLRSTEELVDVARAVERAQDDLPRTKPRASDRPRERDRPAPGATCEEGSVQLSLFSRDA